MNKFIEMIKKESDKKEKEHIKEFETMRVILKKEQELIKKEMLLAERERDLIKREHALSEAKAKQEAELASSENN